MLSRRVYNSVFTRKFSTLLKFISRRMSGLFSSESAADL